MAEGVFISYRRDDAPGHAGRLYDRMVARFGQHRVFMDVDSIDPGEDFVEAIDTTLTQAEVVVVIIGPHWATARDEEGVLRLTNPDDFVLLEVKRSLELGKRVIPVLVEGARAPGPGALPEDLRALARRNAFELSDARFHSDADRLNDSIAEMLSPATAVVPAAESTATAPTPPPPPEEPAPPAEEHDRDEPLLVGRIRRLGLPLIAAIAVALVMVIAALVWSLTSRGDDGTTATTDPNTGGTIAEARPPSVVSVVSTGENPAELEVAGGSLWVSVKGALERYGPADSTAAPQRTMMFDDAGFGNEIIVGDGVLYVTRYAGMSLVEVDSASGERRNSLDLPGQALAGVVVDDTLWVAVHPADGAGLPGLVAVRDQGVVDEIPLPALPFGAVAAGDRIWVTYSQADAIGWVDPSTGEQSDPIPVGDGPVDIQAIRGQLWVTLSGEDRVALIDPDSERETGSVTVGDSPWKVAEGFGAVWVTNKGNGTVSRIDPTSLSVTDEVEVGAEPDELAIGPSHVFVGNFAGNSVSVIDPGV